ncbi:MAG: galactokinase [Anaerolineales bacterium]|nr:galactokinase [Anaerolineales bacterium]
MAVQTLFQEYFKTSSTISTRAPGRVNLMGAHVDYNDGPVIPAAIDRAVYLSGAADAENTVTLYAHDLEAQITFQLDTLESKTDINGDPLPEWALYPAGVAWSLQKAGLDVLGLKAVYTSDVPVGAGLSSSAAVEVVFAVTWGALGGWEIDSMRLAQLCQRAENEYVGVASGLMDQFASIHGVEDHALYFDTRDLTWEPVPLPTETALVIADSGVRRSLTTSAYNERRASCEQAVELLKEYMPEIRSLRNVSPVEFAAFGDFLPPVVRHRAEHVVKEIARVQSALAALRSNNTQSFGALMFSGHASSRDLYEASCPELDALVEIAHAAPGCIGARLTGAGFGGCTVNLVEESKTSEFIDTLVERYHEKTGRETDVYLCRASAGASVEKV